MLKTIKDFKEFIATTIAILTMIGFNLDEAKEYMYMYNVHIILLVLGMDYMIYKLVSIMINKKVNKVDLELKDFIKQARIDGTKKEIRQLMEKTSKFKVIDNQHTIKYVYELDNRRKHLDFNSEYQDMCEFMLDKISFNKRS